MHAKTWAMTGILVASMCFLAAPTVQAQPHHDDDHGDHHDDRGITRHRENLRIITPLGKVTTDYRQYRFIVPSAKTHGSYYTHQDKHYYTPAAPAHDDHHADEAAQRPAAIEFGKFKHHEQLAQRLESMANEFCLDLHHNYQQSPGYREIYSEAYQLLEAAKFVHSAEHRDDHRAIQQSANKIDSLFHHVHAEVINWTSANRRSVGRLRLSGKMEEMEALVHHLAYDVGVTPQHGQQANVAAPAIDAEVERAPAP